MQFVETIGYVAAGLVLTTFCMRSMCALRGVAIAGNLAFIAYGYLGDLMPVLILHLILLPINVYRLVELTHWNSRIGIQARAPRDEPKQPNDSFVESPSLREKSMKSVKEIRRLQP